MPEQAGLMGRTISSELFAFLGRFAALLCVPLIGWVLITMVHYGEALSKMDGQITSLSSQIISLTSQIQTEMTTRYSANEAARDFAYRDQEIKGLTDHMIDAEHDISGLKDRVSKAEGKR